MFLIIIINTLNDQSCKSNPRSSNVIGKTK